MHLTLHRFHFDKDYTIGRLFINGVAECFTLEDTVRELRTRPVNEWKIQNKTAIPARIYNVDITFSNRFGRKLPILLEVPGFTGVRIHPGNSSANTEGCILVGKNWNGGDWIEYSRLAFDKLYTKMVAAHTSGEQIYMEVT